jgi:hypothetical protein
MDRGRADLVEVLCGPAGSAAVAGRICSVYAIQLPPEPDPRFRVETIVVPLGSAAVVAMVATLVETRTVASTWSACDVGINAGANGLYLLIQMPVLWVTQWVLIGVPAPLLALISRNRLVVTAAMALFAALVVGSVAWVFFAHSGLPIGGDALCPGTQPGWWPPWLPPSPSPFG